VTEPRHTNPVCIARMLNVMVAIESYRRLWPEHCATCRGRGVVQNLDLCREDECPLCLMADNCPRCRTEGLGPKPHPVCSHCGWSFVAGGEPQLPPCSCNAEVARG
jgi:hypothetical protein